MGVYRGAYSGAPLAARYAFGIPRTVEVGFTLSATHVGNANNIFYYRVAEGGNISAIRLRVGTQSGNICVGVYRASGSGLSAVPGARAATSGSVACPATGDADVSLTASVVVNPGDFLAIQADNTTATFARAGGGVASGATSLMAGLAYREAAAGLPLPAAAGSVEASDLRFFVLVGV
jgi:hypothetical protein